MNLFGHPVHPMLIPLPIGAFAFGFISLLLYVFGRDGFWFDGAYWLTLAGVLSALVAAIAGFADWLGIPNDSRNKNIGLWHMVLNLTLVAVFFGSWLMMGGFGGPASAPDTSIPLVMQFVGMLMLLASGWLGGEMVFGKGEEEQKPEEQPKQERQAGRPAA
jgi:uncharacterized membrane protein